MAAAEERKNWVINSLLVNDEDVYVVDSESINSKLKVDVDKSLQIIRIFLPGSIMFSDKDYKESQGSRLATDMDLRKIPDKVLHNLDLNKTDARRHQDGKVLFLQNNNRDASLKISIELASKWSLKEAYQTIQECKNLT
jgi:hypothetical protein